MLATRRRESQAHRECCEDDALEIVVVRVSGLHGFGLRGWQKSEPSTSALEEMNEQTSPRQAG